MSEFNFKSQPYTTIEQSQRLIALGLKVETADCCHWFCISCVDEPIEGENIPAWSLHRLIEMMPNNIHKYNDIADLSVSNELVQYRFYDVDYNHDVCLEHFNDGTLYDNLIDCIEWLINAGYFNEEYFNKEIV